MKCQIRDSGGMAKNKVLVISFQESIQTFFLFRWIARSRRWQMFFKIGVLKNSANLTGKHLCWSLFLIKLQYVKPATSLKRDCNTSVFVRNSQNFQKHLFLQNTSGGWF